MSEKDALSEESEAGANSSGSGSGDSEIARDDSGGSNNKSGDKNKNTEENREEQGLPLRKRPRFLSQVDHDRIVKEEMKKAVTQEAAPELNAAKERIGELEAEIRQRDARAAAGEAARKAGVKNIDLFLMAFERKLKIDAEGHPENLEQVLKDARQNFPELFITVNRGSADGAAGNSSQPRLSMNDLLRAKR
jgi:hypothetical protein